MSEFIQREKERLQDLFEPFNERGSWMTLAQGSETPMRLGIMEAYLVVQFFYLMDGPRRTIFEIACSFSDLKEVFMPSGHHILLSEAERSYLLEFISTGTSSAQQRTRARMLLKADQAGWTDTHLSQALEVSRPTVERVAQSLRRTGPGRGPPSKEALPSGQSNV